MYFHDTSTSNWVTALTHPSSYLTWSCFISDLIWHISFFSAVWAFYHRRLDIRTAAKHTWPWQSSGQRTSVLAFHGFLWLRSTPDTVLDWHDSALLGTDNMVLGGSSPCHATDPVPTCLQTSLCASKHVHRQLSNYDRQWLKYTELQLFQNNTRSPQDIKIGALWLLVHSSVYLKAHKIIS